MRPRITSKPKRTKKPQSSHFPGIRARAPLKTARTDCNTHSRSGPYGAGVIWIGRAEPWMLRTPMLLECELDLMNILIRCGAITGSWHWPRRASNAAKEVGSSDLRGGNPVLQGGAEPLSPRWFST